MRIVYATGGSLRHTAFLAELTAIFPPVLIVREPTSAAPESPLVARYRSEVSREEQRRFGGAQRIPYPVLAVGPGASDQPHLAAAIRDALPDLLLVFGTALLSREVVATARWGALNIHTGITQLFRGVDSAFWAVHDERPEGIGATVHMIDDTIDAGPVLAQARPVIAEDDSLATLFIRSVDLGIQLMREAVLRIEKARTIDPTPLPVRGRLYRRRDLTDLAIDRAEEKRARVLRSYVAAKVERDAALPIAAMTTPSQTTLSHRRSTE